ncbi:Flp pilus assembly protein CpaB [Kocuria sp. cx-455]|uniref:Flp pilus assembly protein CpaB n=1 Tax=Kocuria sp. cx-455 TaxID=2771377 RepID=UPI0016858E5F|nr:RcpC/CpaB family pilus assembly protein [Kocuria sp. cx-455]MBD2764410.1 Flp pilus assembly protein CpaB [Kocuria sp. cx-455]
MSSRARARYPLSLRFRTAVNRRHRLVAAALCAVALTLLILRFAPPSAQTSPVVTVVNPIPAGQALTSSNLDLRDVPVDWVPDGALTDPALVTGQPATVALVPGQFLTESAVLGPGLLEGQAEGTTAASIRVSDPAVLRHIRPGDSVDVVHQPDSAEHDSLKTVAESVTVLWSAPADTGQDSSLLSASGTDSDLGLVVLAAPRETASGLAALDGSGRTSLVLVAN